MAHKQPPEDGLERRLREAKDRRSEPLREQAQRMLEQFQNGRTITATPPTATTVQPASKRKRRRPKSKSKGAKSAVLADAAARSMVNQLVTPEAQRHGDYRLVDFKIQEVVQDGRVKATTIRVVRNVGGTPVERWARRGKLEERQLAAILFYQVAFQKVFGSGPSVTASYSPVIVRGFQGAVELWARSGIAAKEALRLLDQEVFFRRPVADFEVWQNVVIWDEPAGVAGSRVGFCHKPAEAVAQFIVSRIAGEIADIVIDNSRHDFADLLVNLDAARKPGRRG